MNAKLFKSLGFESIHDLENFLNRDDVKQIIGAKKYDHFRELWLSEYEHKIMGEPKKKIKGKTNWLALTATPFVWYAYRKMYALVIGFCAVLTILNIADLYYGLDTTIPMIIVVLALAFLSKDMYLDHLVKCAKKIDAMPEQRQKENFIKRRKGTSALLAIITLLFLSAESVYITILMAEKMGIPLESLMDGSLYSTYPQF